MEAIRLSAPWRLSFSAALRARDSAIFKTVSSGLLLWLVADSEFVPSEFDGKEWWTRVATKVEPSVEKTFARSIS